MSFAIFPAHSFDITTDCLFPLETPSLADVLFPEHFPQESGREEGNRSGNSGGCYSQVRGTQADAYGTVFGTCVRGVAWVTFDES